MTLSASSPGNTSRTPWPTASRFTQDDEHHGGKKSPPNGANVGRPSKAEIGPANFRIVDQVAGRALADDMAGLHDITTVRAGKRQMHVLFDQQDRHPFVANG